MPVLAMALAASTLWSGATSYYIVFHDEMLGRFFGQVRAVQLAYEAQVGALQTQVERSDSERVRNREGFEGRLTALTERQALIEKRQGLLAGLGAGDPETTGSIPAAPPRAQPIPAQPQKPFPTPGEPADSFDLRMRGGDRAEAPERRLDRHIAGLATRLDRLAERQSQVLGGIAATAVRKADRFRGVILQAGVDPARFYKFERGIGGPLVPLSGDTFDLALAEAQRAAADAERLNRTVAALPFRRPLAEDAVTTSEFGARFDPFTRGLAMHTGLDMRADHGTAARATAAGRVTAAEYGGGYGNMVEIDHGQGFVTRYAHLASYTVAPGQRVEAGAVVGRVGSTGRSTGNHLHYEVRIDGQPVDPERFLRAGASLSGEVADTSPGVDGLGTGSWLAWSKAQLQKLALPR
ncbi:M23 family metallopeptidase [Methylobacterium haplocladii]|uniref:Membrane protein n=1 Tax=Methylobacterium haplocladii TaxID=1176176 RepID=A0A512IKM4_9HYPH|nr:peptidoglycan DD-metalloendopeptidase family protein [Methylobacterium haplocladii]GEO98277.1 membrane protein [Methylobacterium haplocladii]GJD84328.1 hypothetical protein HPGCJGGD_2204 [Methylobacterium haplocladii]GLS58429.1 membrane protein [Methylobacterium haplocladii]